MECSEQTSIEKAVSLPEKEMLSVREVAKLFGVSEVTVRQWLYEGKLAAIKTPTGLWRIPRSEVEKYLETKPSG